ncbi:hypothetical protein ANCCAN_26759 [Ancylostoma caninum]|uniref:Uncharacterized protein n=1 Tax=Ancylostoma caninum TaxID=29170 RepID=A0A368FBF5_ANCCA|nr:hypothetical protein ANCCAN_26759 [Ancylostoma caninum]
MDPDKQKAEGDKLYSTLSETEKKELEEIKNKTMKKAKELGIDNPIGILDE